MKTTLYESIAGRIEHLIATGTYHPGDKIPSIRSLKSQMKVSIATVMEAYRLLEDQQLVECRPQSGYYVLPPVAGGHPEISLSRPSATPTKVNIDDLVTTVFNNDRKPDLIRLGAAIPAPELLPVHRINRALAAVARIYPARNLEYEFSPGCKELRTQIARRALTAGCTFSPDDIVITSGCQEAIILALKVLCKPGDAVAIESPTYYNFLQAIEMLGLKALEIPSHARESVNLDALRNAIKRNRLKTCLFMTNFSNPLGSCMPDDRKKELVELLLRYDIPLIEDDTYGDLSYSYRRPTVAKAYDKTGMVLLCSSFSKTIAPGYRVGWIVPGKFREKIERIKSITNLAVSTPPQLALALFLSRSGYDRHLRSIRTVYARNAGLLAEAVLKDFPSGTKVSRPQGGQVLWVELPPHIDSLSLYEKALGSGISFAPGPIFSSRRKFRNFLRLNASGWNETIKEAVKTLGTLAQKERTRRAL